MKLKRVILLFVVFLLVLTAPTFAQQLPPDAPPDNSDQNSCDTVEHSFESLLLITLATLEEQRQEHVGDKNKNPHLFLPPFEALFGIGSGIAISADFVSQFIPPLPAPAPPTVEVDNLTLFGLNNACETIETSSDPN